MLTVYKVMNDRGKQGEKNKQMKLKHCIDIRKLISIEFKRHYEDELET